MQQLVDKYGTQKDDIPQHASGDDVLLGARRWFPSDEHPVVWVTANRCCLEKSIKRGQPPSHQLLHQRNVTQKIPMCCREATQQVVLQPLKLNLEVGPLPGHHLSQQLLLQAHRSHCEVDEGGLGLELRREMGIIQLGVDDELKLHHPQLWPEPVSDPLDALLLRVDDERPTLTGGQDGSVLGGHPVIWQALVMPGSHSGIICKHEDGIQAFCHGHRDLERKQRNDVTVVEQLEAAAVKSVHLVLELSPALLQKGIFEDGPEHGPNLCCTSKHSCTVSIWSFRKSCRSLTSISLSEYTLQDSWSHNTPSVSNNKDRMTQGHEFLQLHHLTE
ncbi:hypothetical protein EYF80_011372 [Liparis tanakae]|uniref:Uncharacterized protein n=1 Tax=Liparis tanakae TaxID=230148 RepID=A0A4Z2IKW5_9TELE|nr:hypothetical protein EYF80_011372 [Liparis tanakae]